MRAPLAVAALVLAAPAAAAEPEPAAAGVTPELLEYLGQSAGIDVELADFMESRAARRAMKDAAKEQRKEDDHE